MSSTLRQIADSLAAGLQAVSWPIVGTSVERRNWPFTVTSGVSSARSSPDPYYSSGYRVTWP